MENIKFPCPLALDRVMENTPISACNSPLFQIPIEILTIIISQLQPSKNDLGSLALVNTDCRQLARSFQFRSIKFDGGRKSEGLLRLLQREAVERGQNHGQTRKLSLGACVRRVITNNSGYWSEVMASRPLKPGRSIDDDFDDPFDHDEEKIAQWRPIVDQLTHKLNENYRPNVLFVISSLVHLESIDISQADWNQTLLNTIVSLPLRYLTLRDVQMTDIFPVISDLEWPIEGLDIRLSWDLDFRTHTKKSSLDSSKSWEKILRLCSVALKFLKLSHSGILGIEKIKEKAISFDLKFPKMQHLHLLWESDFGPSALRSLVLTSSQLTHISINYGNLVARKVLDDSGHIGSLKAVVLNHTYENEIPIDASFRFLTENPQIKALGFYSDESHILLERIIKITEKSHQLEMLSLTWEGFMIPESSLEALSHLVSLESLHLSSGCQIGWRNDWSIDHEAIIRFCKPLKRLRIIAFTRDAYSYTCDGRTLVYNSYRLLRDEAWDLHWKHMHERAIAYAVAFPELELVHSGEITLKISRLGDSIEVEATDNEEFSWERTILRMLL